MVVIIPLLKVFYSYCKKIKISKLLNPHFTYIDIKNYSKYFINTRFQNQSPSRYQEPSKSHIIASENLIKYLIKNAFVKELEDKFYIILADTGMGKTAFMINLFIKYNSFFNFNKAYEIKLLRFGNNKIEDHINNIHNKSSTILLLDAFDEYNKLNNNSELSDEEYFIEIFNDLINITQDFYLVIVTSRTQYFPHEENNPYELEISKSNGGYHILKKLYISPFNDDEIHKYLNMKYNRFKPWTAKKRKNSKNIVQNCNNLMVRPMLLNYIDYIINNSNIKLDTYNLYESMVEGWLIRESEKRKKMKDVIVFKENLLKYSKLTACELNFKYKDNNDLYLTKKETTDILKNNNIDIKSYEATGQSLLTKDVCNNWKFSHKSIYEFFIAYELLHNYNYIFHVNITNLNFTNELIFKIFSEKEIHKHISEKIGFELFLLISPTYGRLMYEITNTIKNDLRVMVYIIHNCDIFVEYMVNNIVHNMYCYTDILKNLDCIFNDTKPSKILFCQILLKLNLSNFNSEIINIIKSYNMNPNLIVEPECLSKNISKP